MDIHIHENNVGLGQSAANEGVDAIREAIRNRGRAVIVVATGASQFEMLSHLVLADLDWSKVTGFHLDEYIGIPESHPASFRKYLKERFVDKLPTLEAFHFVNGSAVDIDAEVARLNALISSETVDVCFAGIGENCHIAFNDPPADFETVSPYIKVSLDDACRLQQKNEGWFATLEDVPKYAVSMSVQEIMRSKKIVLSVPDERKAPAVRDMLERPISNIYPASILREHENVSLHLDQYSSSLISD